MRQDKGQIIVELTIFKLMEYEKAHCEKSNADYGGYSKLFPKYYFRFCRNTASGMVVTFYYKCMNCGLVGGRKYRFWGNKVRQCRRRIHLKFWKHR